MKSHVVVDKILNSTNKISADVIKNYDTKTEISSLKYLGASMSKDGSTKIATNMVRFG